MESTDTPSSSSGEDGLCNEEVITSAVVADRSRMTTASQAIAATAVVTEVEQVQCECCGLAEECTPAYIARIRGVYFGKWVCGLCAEAVKEERGRRGGGQINEGLEDALRAHMIDCMQFNKPELKGSPVTDIAAAMRRLLRRSMGGSLSPRSAPSSPRRASPISRANSYRSTFSQGFEAPL